MDNDDPQALAEACVAALLESDQATRHLEMQVDEIKPGSCSVAMTVKSTMCNGHGTCHGGYIFTLADSAFAFACNAYNQRSVAHNCSITYINPAREGDRLLARASELSRQGRSGIYDIQVTDQQGTPVAEFRGHSRTIKGTVLPGG